MCYSRLFTLGIVLIFAVTDHSWHHIVLLAPKLASDEVDLVREIDCELEKEKLSFCEQSMLMSDYRSELKEIEPTWEALQIYANMQSTLRRSLSDLAADLEISFVAESRANKEQIFGESAVVSLREKLGKDNDLDSVLALKSFGEVQVWK
jgi:hypothetical protein